MTKAIRLSPAANLVLAAIVFPALFPIGSRASADQFVYSHEFVNGVIYCPGDPQYDDWLSYRASLPTSGVMSVTVSGSQDPIGRTCSDPAVAQQIADAMRTQTTTTVECGGFSWRVGSIGCQEGCALPDNDLVLSVEGDVCNCGSTYNLRPGVGNVSWGGITGTSCGAPTQTMTVTVEFVESDDLIWFNNQAAFEAFNAVEGNLLKGSEDYEESILQRNDFDFFDDPLQSSVPNLPDGFPFPNGMTGLPNLIVQSNTLRGESD